MKIQLIKGDIYNIKKKSTFFKTKIVYNYSTIT